MSAKTSMDEKKKSYIAQNYMAKSTRDMAEHLKIPVKMVEEEITGLILSRKSGFGLKLVMAIFLPLLVLLLSEFGLRLGGQYETYPLLLTEQKNNQDFYRLNKDVAGRWFLNTPTAIPELNNSLLYPVEKSDSTFRILCLGGSTTAGFPFENLPAFPTQLRLILEQSHPRLRIETVNLGVSAINSYSVLDILDETLDLKPDAVVIYMGHNEFYGAFGASSTEKSSSLLNVSTLLWLNRLAIVQNLRKLINLFQPDEKVTQQNKSFMAQMIGETFIPLQSESVERAVINFSENLKAVLDFYRAEGVPVLLSTLVSNLRDHPPFQSDWLEENKVEKARLWATIQSLLSKGQKDSAKAQMALLYARDSTFAGLNYYMAFSYLEQGDTSNASRFFIKAKEYDGLRFRAPEVLNEIIKQSIRADGVYLVPMESEFRENSPGGIPGNNLFLEHLHPNWRGYYLMARTFANSFEKIMTDRESSYIPPPALEENPWYNITDNEIGKIKSAILTAGWPFSNNAFDINKYQSEAPAEIVKKVYDYLRKKGYWNKIHLETAKYFISNKDYKNAIREYEGVAAYLDDYAFPRDKIGLLYIHQGQYKKAFNAYRELINLYPDDPYYFARCGQALAMAGVFESALKYLEKGISDDVKRGRKISEENYFEFKFWLAYTYANTDRLFFAQKQLNIILKRYPNHTRAQGLLQQIKQYQKQNK